MASSQPNQDVALINIYRPLLKKNVKTGQVVPFLVDFLPQDVPRDLCDMPRRDGESQAVETLLDSLIGHNTPGWFSAFTTALEKGGYKYLVGLLRRYKDIKDDSFPLKLINTVLPELVDIDLDNIVPYLHSSGCITQDDVEKIRAEDKNNGQRSAALYMILAYLPSKSEYWFLKFIMALNKGGLKHLSEKIDPKLGSAKSEASVHKIIDGMKQMTLYPKRHTWSTSKPGSDDFQDPTRPAPDGSEQSFLPPAQEPFHYSDEENSSPRFTDDKTDMFTPEERRDIRASSCQSSGPPILPDMVPEDKRTGGIASYGVFLTSVGRGFHGEQASGHREDVCIVSHKSFGCPVQLEFEKHRCFPLPEVETFEKLSKEPHGAAGVKFQYKVEDKQPSDLYSPNPFGKCSVCHIERDMVPCCSCSRRRVCRRCKECKTCRRSSTAKIAKQTQISELHEELNIPQQYRPPLASTAHDARSKSQTVSPASASAPKTIKVSPVRQPPPTTVSSKKSRKSDGVLVSMSQPLQQPKTAPNSTAKAISRPLKPCIVCKCERKMIKCCRCGRKVVCERCDICRKCRRS